MSMWDIFNPHLRDWWEDEPRRTPSTAGRELQQHRASGEREQFKRKTDELREVLGLPAWEWRK